MELHVVNKYSLVYIWGDVKKSKPLMLCSHLDVVPVSNSSLGEWDFPPFSGTIDGDFVYGRG